MSHCKQILSILLFTGILFGCNNANLKNPDQLTAFNEANETDIIDCKLPDKIKRLSRNIIYLAPGRPIKTSLPDCKTRGGRIILAGSTS
jgi:hypothetical protein